MSGHVCSATDLSVSRTVSALLNETVTKETFVAVTPRWSSGHDSLAPNDPVLHDEDIHVRSKEAIKSFLGAADNGLILVEGSIKQNGHTG